MRGQFKTFQLKQYISSRKMSKRLLSPVDGGALLTIIKVIGLFKFVLLSLETSDWVNGLYAVHILSQMCNRL